MRAAAGVEIRDNALVLIKHAQSLLLRGYKSNLALICQRVVRDVRSQFRKGKYARTGPRGGWRPVPKPTKERLTSRRYGRGYVGAIHYIVRTRGLAELPEGIVEVNPRHPSGAHIYAPALAARNPEGWNPFRQAYGAHSEDWVKLILEMLAKEFARL